MKTQLFNFIANINCLFFFLYLLVSIILDLQPFFFQSICKAAMGSMTVKAVNADQLISSDNITISRTTLKSLASQERNITINDVSGIVMVTGFTNILTSTTLNSSHNGVLLVSGNTTLTLPDPSSALGIKYTIKKIDSSINILTISGIIDGESNPQLSEQYSYITIISDGSTWYKIAQNAASSTSSYENQTYISNSLGMTFRLIPAGTFVMGSPTDELGRGSDEAQYTVTLSESFYIQTTEVTQGQWKAVMGSNPSVFTDCGLNCPVEQITWNDAQTFIAALNAMGEGSYTLPTEAQWEYTARAGSNKAFANGDISNTTTDPNLDIMGWYSSNSGSTPHAVAQKQANAWGLFDMHGNIFEWCNDWYGTYPTGSVTDPVGALSGTYRVLRGCYWVNNAQNCRLAKRGYGNPDTNGDSLGVRLVRIN